MRPMLTTKTVKAGFLKNVFVQPLGTKHIVDYTHHYHTLLIAWRKWTLVLHVAFTNTIAQMLWESYQDANGSLIEEYYETAGQNQFETDAEWQRHQSRIWWREWRRQMRMRIRQETIGRLLCSRFGHPKDQTDACDDGDAESGPRFYWACGRCGQGGGGYY